MSKKRPIEAFYIPKRKAKRNISQKSTGSLFSRTSQVLPSFTYIDEIYPHDSISHSPFGHIPIISNLSQRENSLDTTSKLSSQESVLTKNSIVKDKEISRREKRKRWLPIGIAFCIAICLIAIVVLLAVILSKDGKKLF
jgi:hypothetical protein